MASDFIEDLPFGNPSIDDPLKRTTISISLNTEEGAGKVGMKDKPRYYGMARVSVMEFAAIYDALKILKLVKDPRVQERNTLLFRILAMHTKICRSCKFPFTFTCTFTFTGKRSPDGSHSEFRFYLHPSPTLLILETRRSFYSCGGARCT